MGKNKKRDSDDESVTSGTSATSVATATSVTSASSVTTATSATSDVSRRSERVRKRKRNDDSLEEELTAKYAKPSGSKPKKAQPPKKLQVGVKPNPQSKAKRQAALEEAKILSTLRTKQDELDKEQKHMDETLTPGKAAQTQDKENDFLTPRKKALLDEIEQLKKSLASAKTDSSLGDKKEVEKDASSLGDKKEVEKDASSLGDKKEVEKDADPVDLNNPDPEDNPFFEDNADRTIIERKEEEGGKTFDYDYDSAKEAEKSNINRKHKKRHSKSKKEKKKKKKSKKSHKKKKSKGSSSSSSSSDSSSSDEKSKRCKKSKKVRKPKVNYTQLINNEDTSDVEEIVPKSGVYMKASAVAAVRRCAKSHTSAARMYLSGVFTDIALSNCSMKGNPTKGPLGKLETPRPPLCEVALEAVLKAAENLAKKRGFPIREPRIVNHEIGTKMSEVRKATKV